MSEVLGLDHVSIIVKDAEKSLTFYQELLGLSLANRPDLGFPGYWLDLGLGQTIHIMQLENPTENVVRPEHGGRDYHFALSVRSVDALAQKLSDLGLPYTLSKSGRKALFAKDLDNNAFELIEKPTNASL